jgi:hypothetical protein
VIDAAIAGAAGTVGGGAGVVATVVATVMATVVEGRLVLDGVTTAAGTGASVDSLTEGGPPPAMICVLASAATEPAPSTPTSDRTVAILVFMSATRRRPSPGWVATEISQFGIVE